MSIKKRDRDGTWYYRFNLDRQTYQEYGFPTWAEARDAQNRCVKEIQDGKKQSNRQQNIKTLSVRDAAQIFYDEYAKDLNGWRNYQPHLVAIAGFFRNKRLIDLEKEDGKNFINHVLRTIKTKKWTPGGIVQVPVSKHTAQHYFTTLKTVINWWITEKDARIINPMMQVELESIPKARVRFLYPAEEKILTPAVKKNQNMWPYYFTALETGLREWNLAEMLVDHVDFILDQIFIPDSKTGASGYIPISDRLKPWLERWARGKNKTDRILGNYAQDTISHYFTEIVREAGIDDFTFHDLRHTFAYNLLRQGKPLYVVSKLLMHKNTKTTENHYGHLAVKDLGDVVNSAEGYVSGVTPKLTPEMHSLEAESIKIDEYQL